MERNEWEFQTAPCGQVRIYWRNLVPFNPEGDPEVELVRRLAQACAYAKPDDKPFLVECDSWAVYWRLERLLGYLPADRVIIVVPGHSTGREPGVVVRSGE